MYVLFILLILKKKYIYHSNVVYSILNDTLIETDLEILIVMVNSSNSWHSKVAQLHLQQYLQYWIVITSAFPIAIIGWD